MKNRSQKHQWIHKQIAFFLFSNLLICGCTHSEAWRRHRPQAALMTAVPALPKFHDTQLSNGLTVLTTPLPTLPIVHVQVTLKVGSAQDPTGQEGTAYLMGQMLRESTSQHSSINLAKAFGDLGSQVNVQVSQDAIHLWVGVLQHHADKAVQLLAQMLQQPAFSQKDFVRVRTKHLASLQHNQAKAPYTAMATFWQEAYGQQHPYGHSIYGNVDSVKKLQRAHVVQMWQSYVGSQSTALLLSGHVSPQKAQQLAQKHFAQWQNSTGIVVAPPDPPAPEQLAIHVIPRANAPQTFVLLGTPALRPGQPNNAALLVLNEILGGMFTSRLNLKLREEKGWTYGSHATLQTLRGLGPLLIYANIQQPHAPAAVTEILAQLDQLQQTPPSDKEVQAAKQHLLRSFPGRFNTVGSMSQHMASLFVRNLPFDYHRQLLENIASVTPQHIFQVAQETLSSHQMHAVLVGDPTHLQPESFQLPNAQITVHPPTP
ncbi:MAG: pitrilysin family protein [Myxococcota bacterium]